nr:PREDICTED: deacetylvindoline O-acetyltransferase-like [Daucus carota subsp. sativus]
MLFFYPHGKTPKLKAYNTTSTTTISNLLQCSLSEALSKYYPFAGRLISASRVDCSDQGVDFFETRIGCKLSEIHEKSLVKGDEYSAHLFPPGSIWGKVIDQDSSLVRVQLNHFDCGGIAIAASVSHRLGDAATVCSFLCYWANLSRHSGDHQKSSHFGPHFAYELQYHDSVKPEVMCPEKYWVTKEIVFLNTKIAKLKAAVQTQDRAERYTRNELLTALLYRCAVAAAAATSESGAHAPSVLFNLVNMRKVMDPPLPTTAVGNIVSTIHIPTTTESETSLNQLVQRMRKAKMQLKGTKNSSGFQLVPPLLNQYMKSNHRVVFITSMCNFPIYQEMDFGWGRPTKVTLVDTPFIDCITLMDTWNGDGIKAVVSLEQKNMEHFVNNPSLLAYASVL